MQNVDPFMLEPSQYGRDVDVFKHYTEDAAYYLSSRTGRSFSACLDYVKRVTGPGGKFEVKDPTALFLAKHKRGTRTKDSMPFTQYLKTAFENDWILSPTLVTYINPNQRRSLLGRYVKGNIQKRNKTKKEMFTAKKENDDFLASILNGRQSSFKIKNNSLSGGHASPYTILFNKSSHSSLTSTTRSATGYGNANNEKLLLGNRHYWSPEVTKANIISIARNTDLNKVREVVDKYSLVLPTVDQCMDCVRYSTMFYWATNEDEHQNVRHLLEGLSDLERAAFVYVGDMYHLAVHNPEVVRDFLGRLIKQGSPGVVDNPGEIVGSLDDDTEALVKYLCVEYIKEYGEKDERSIDVMASTAVNVQSVLSDYESLIRSLWTTHNVPASIASVPSIIRRTAIASDTDSSIFTAQYWTEWYTGKAGFDRDSNAIRDAIAFLSSKSMAHVLALMTAQLGVVEEDRPLLSMKNEFTFPTFSLTNRSKHYFAYVSAQEGTVFDELDLELKGVALRNSNSPKNIREGSQKFIKDMMTKVMQGEKLSLMDTLSEVASIEREIYDVTVSGRYDYFRTGQVKPADSYKNPGSSPFIHYELWEEVFADKYGHAENPPYTSVKVSVEGDNPTKLKQWLDSMDDQVIADKLLRFLHKKGRKDLTTILLPEPVLRVTGVPEEIIAGVNTRKLIGDIMEPYYLVLESIGFYVKDDKNSILVSDTN